MMIQIDDIFEVLPLPKLLDIIYTLDNQIKLYETYSFDTQKATKKIHTKQKRLIKFLIKKVSHYFEVDSRKFNNITKKYL